MSPPCSPGKSGLIDNGEAEALLVDSVVVEAEKEAEHFVIVSMPVVQIWVYEAMVPLWLTGDGEQVTCVCCTAEALHEALELEALVDEL